MLTYALVVEAKAGSMPPGVVALLRDRALAEVPFTPRRHVVWCDGSKSVVFGGWQSTGEDDPIGGRVDRDDDGSLTAFTGHVWPRRGSWASRRPWAAQLAHYLRSHGLDGGTDDLLGVFTALRVDRDGGGTLASDALGLGLVYWAQHRDMMVFSSRVSIAARVLAVAEGVARPQRDVVATGVLAHGGRWTGPGTGYEGVEVLPPDAMVVIRPRRGATVRRGQARTWRFASPRALHPEDMVHELRSDMASSLRAALSVGVPRHILNLTGGRDSRVILAGILDQGLAAEFEYHTWGADDLPDVVIARQIADAFDLRLAVNDHAAQGIEWRLARDDVLDATGQRRHGPRETNLRLTVGATLGMWNVDQPQVACPPLGDRAVLSGLTGELLRTNFPDSGGLTSLADLGRFLFDGMAFGRAGILRPDVRAHYDQQLWQAVFADLDQGDTPQDVVDAFFLRQWLRPWFGAGDEVDEHNRMFPLYSPFAVRCAFEMGVAARRSEWFHHEVIRGASERLAEVPFAKAGWPETATPVRPQRRHRRQAHRRASSPPVPPARQPRPFASGASTAHRTMIKDLRDAQAATDAEVMRRYLLDDASNPVHDLLDPVGVRAALDGFGELAGRAKSELYGALTAAIWLGGEELTYRAGVDELPPLVAPAI